MQALAALFSVGSVITGYLANLTARFLTSVFAWALMISLIAWFLSYVLSFFFNGLVLAAFPTLNQLFLSSGFVRIVQYCFWLMGVDIWLPLALTLLPFRLVMQNTSLHPRLK